MFPQNSPPPLPPPLPAPRPPVWSALVLPVCAIVASLVFAGVVQVAALAATGAFQQQMKLLIPPPVPAEHGKTNTPPPGPQLPDFTAHFMQSLTKFLDRPYAVTVLVVPGQMIMLGAALGAAALSRRRLKDRLGYVRSALPWWSLPVLMLATLFFGMVGGLVVDRLFPGPHETMEFFAAMARSGSTPVAVLNTALLSLVPGFVEESLFRGYVQRRLLERWSPVAAIAVSTAFFCAAHFDPQHVIAVVPVGAWLGVIAWRCATVWPGMLCHATMNAISFTAMRFSAGQENRSITPATWVVLAVGAVTVLLAAWLMRRYPPSQ